MLDMPAVKPTLDYRAINRKACRHWRVTHAHLLTLHGHIVGSVLAELNPAAAARRAEKREPPRRLVHFKIDESSGRWSNIGSGDSGEDVISIVQWLAYDCPRQDAAEWLHDLCSRIVELPLRSLSEIISIW
jgi:hypothetical protein